MVFTYQGDGDLAAIGTAESFHAANRGELFTVFFINNAVYGMTGGQMAPTTLLGQKTTTSPAGRNPLLQGYPLKFSEVLAGLEGTSYIERVAVNSPANIRRTRQAIVKGFQHQLKKTGFSMVEILSPCPTNWRMAAPEACRWIDEATASVMSSLGDTSSQAPPVFSARSRSRLSAGELPTPTAKTRCPDWVAAATVGSMFQTSPSVISRTSIGCSEFPRALDRKGGLQGLVELGAAQVRLGEFDPSGQYLADQMRRAGFQLRDDRLHMCFRTCCTTRSPPGSRPGRPRAGPRGLG